ncbi:hypothetical protein ACSVH5_05220 [Flavobacterium sp. RSSA_27]|uniref:hypothetical protein n=1 Tax=Flavobacterium sp. RSSA_27 TaxID=3447667 RepID=UPI003F3BFF58
MKKICLLILLLFCFKNYSQKKFEFFGGLKLNGNDKTIITYRLVFEWAGTTIKGYSITDLGGDNETKNSISGTFDNKNKILVFKEDDILYTKSTFSEKSFCFVNFNGRVKLSDKTPKIDGNFSGLYKNKKKCINGTITLVGSEKIYKVLNKVNDKIQKSKKIDNETKSKANPINLLDSLKVNNLTKDQNLNVFVKSDAVDIEIFDSETEDGDKINLYHNDRIILSNYTILNSKKKIAVVIEKGNNIFKIEALNQGDKGLNTVTVKIIDNERVFDLKTSLKTNEKAAITFIKN